MTEAHYWNSSSTSLHTFNTLLLRQSQQDCCFQETGNYFSCSPFQSINSCICIYLKLTQFCFFVFLCLVLLPTSPEVTLPQCGCVLITHNAFLSRLMHHQWLLWPSAHLKKKHLQISLVFRFDWLWNNLLTVSLMLSTREWFSPLYGIICHQHTSQKNKEGETEEQRTNQICAVIFFSLSLRFPAAQSSCSCRASCKGHWFRWKEGREGPISGWASE